MCPLDPLALWPLDPLTFSARCPLPTWGPATLSMVVASITLKQLNSNETENRTNIFLSKYEFEWFVQLSLHAALLIVIRSKSFYTPTETVSVSTVSLSIFSSTASCNGHGSKYCTDNNQLLFAKNKSLRLEAWVYNHTDGPRLLLSCDTIQYWTIPLHRQYHKIWLYQSLPLFAESE